MATSSQLMGETPAQIKHGSSVISSGAWYTIQNRSHLTAFVQVAVNSPQNTHSAFSLAPNQTMQIKKTGTEKAWVWQSDPSGTGSYGLLIVDTAT